MVWLADIHTKSISFQKFLNSASRSEHTLKCFELFRFYVKNEICSRWKFSCSPVFLHFLCTVPHHYPNPDSLNFQLLSPSINLCVTSQNLDLNHLFSFLLFSSCCVLGIILKPRGVFRQSSNLENHHPSAAHSVTHTYICTHTVGCDIPWWCMTGWREVSKLHQDTSQAEQVSGCCLQPSVPLRAVISSC